jgi:hypothetical protein
LAALRLALQAFEAQACGRQIWQSNANSMALNAQDAFRIQAAQDHPSQQILAHS